MIHHRHRRLPPLESLGHPEPVDQLACLVVLREDVVVVRLDGLAADSDRARQTADRGSRLDQDDPPSSLERPLRRAQAGHAAAEDDSVVDGIGHVRSGPLALRTCTLMASSCVAIARLGYDESPVPDILRTGRPT